MADMIPRSSAGLHSAWARSESPCCVTESTTSASSGRTTCGFSTSSNLFLQPHTQEQPHQRAGHVGAEVHDQIAEPAKNDSHQRADDKSDGGIGERVRKARILRRAHGNEAV